jgi:hypothetical protein
MRGGKIKKSLAVVDNNYNNYNVSVIFTALLTIIVIHVTRIIIFDTVNKLYHDNKHIDNRLENNQNYGDSMKPKDSNHSVIFKITDVFPKKVEANNLLASSESSTTIPSIQLSASSSQLTWQQFLDKPFSISNSKNAITNYNTTFHPILCSQVVLYNLSNPRLNDDDIRWCEWATHKDGGQVKIGKSWGLLNKLEQVKFDKLTCNHVYNNVNGVGGDVSSSSSSSSSVNRRNNRKSKRNLYNPSCNDIWGDDYIANWRKQRIEHLSCSFKNKEGGNYNYNNDNDIKHVYNQNKSNMTCYVNNDKSKFCILEKVMINFRKFKKFRKKLGNNYPSSKLFEKDFMTIDCNNENDVLEQFTFPYLISSTSSSSLSSSSSSSSSSSTSSHSRNAVHEKYNINHNDYKNMDNRCDSILNGTIILFSHDNIRNMGHTMNDILNVWLMLWLDYQASNMHNLSLLTIDALKLYNSFDDIINQFFTTYQKSFSHIYQGSMFHKQTLCIGKFNNDDIFFCFNNNEVLLKLCYKIVFVSMRAYLNLK